MNAVARNARDIWDTIQRWTSRWGHLFSVFTQPFCIATSNCMVWRMEKRKEKQIRDSRDSFVFAAWSSIGPTINFNWNGNAFIHSVGLSMNRWRWFCDRFFVVSLSYVFVPSKRLSFFFAENCRRFHFGFIRKTLYGTWQSFLDAIYGQIITCWHTKRAPNKSRVRYDIL